MQTFMLWFLIFMTYSFLGWLMEVIVGIAERRKVVNRGFLIGPICPIYGVGAVLLSNLLPADESPLAVFCVSIVGAAILEYATSFIMEKLFRVRWWDYSERPMNLNGRICLEALIGFGIIGVLIVKILTPTLLKIYGGIPPTMLYALSGILLAVLIFDIALSLWLILGVRVTVGAVAKDATEEISERVHEILTEKGKLNRRLVKAFPYQTPAKKSPRKSGSSRSRAASRASRSASSSTPPNNQSPKSPK